MSDNDDLRSFCKERGIRYATDHDTPHVLMEMLMCLAAECMNAAKAAESSVRLRPLQYKFSATPTSQYWVCGDGWVWTNVDDNRPKNEMG